jgi:tRNA(Ile)-lysidine synthase
MADQLVERARQAIDRESMISPGDTIVVGVSGGPDSLCLLHVLTRLAPEYELHLHVAHLHHGLRAEEADADSAFVEQLAADWGLPVTIDHAGVPALAEAYRLAVEEVARRARYAFLADVAAAAGAQSIAVGHNADDQAETVLMHFLRGSGLAGLRGMLPVTSLDDYRLLDAQAASDKPQDPSSEPTNQRTDDSPAASPNPKSKILNPKLIRPLLDIPRADILSYCAQHGLQPRFDRSNLDTTYFRNWLRHDVLPLLARHNPNVAEVLRRSARVIAGDYALLRSLLDDAWPRIVLEESPDAIVLDLAAWRALPTGLQRSSLREAIHRLRRSLRNINFVHVENALLVARDGTAGQRATLPAGLMLTLGYDRLTVAGEEYSGALPDWPLLPPGSRPLPLAVPGRTVLPGGEWALDARRVTPGELPEGWQANANPWQAFLDAAAAGRDPALRTRRDGDRFQPQGLAGHSTKLADFLTNHKAGRAARDRLPLLVCDWGIAWVCGYRLDERAAIRSGTMQVLVLRFVRL